MKTITADVAQVDFAQMLFATVKQHQNYRIASEYGGAILLSEENYEGLVETLELLSVPGLYESIKRTDLEVENGEHYAMDEIFGDE